MIPVNELRPGNRIYKDGQMIILNAHEIADVWSQQAGIKGFELNLLKPDYYAPIKLTPEILIKSSFEKEDENTFNINMGGRVLFKLWRVPSTNGSWLWYSRVTAKLGPKEDSIAVDFNPPQNLHNLQNLYFVMTGQELQIKI